LRKAGADNLPQQRFVRYLRRNLRPDAQTHDCAPDLWRRPKCLWWHIEQLFGFAISFDQDREITAIGRTGLSREAVDDLALQHQDHFAEALALVDLSLQNCSGNVVRKIRDDARVWRRRDRFAEVGGEGIRFQQIKIRDAGKLRAQERDELPVELDRYDPPGCFQ